MDPELTEDYESGLEYKLIKPETAVSELNYGLARVYAEAGHFHFPAAYNYYLDAITEKLTQGVSHNAGDYTSYYFI